MGVDPPLDKIYIRDLGLRCVVGVYPEERREKQDVLINVTLHADLRSACQADRMEHTLDYKGIKKRIVAMVEQSSHFLIERLAECVAQICLEDPRVQRVEVTVDKPGALRFARSVAVEIARKRPSNG
jgi:dihydroneopterin aldolase/D-erythro-7,8-dihydroneopterin triphosphate epimerase